MGVKKTGFPPPPPHLTILTPAKLEGIIILLGYPYTFCCQVAHFQATKLNTNMKKINLLESGQMYKKVHFQKYKKF